MTNVFVLTPGRTASTTFALACANFSNYTAGHETKSRMIGKKRLIYPKNHIEVDNRLVWFLDWLYEIYGDNAKYVYLRRDLDKVAESYAKRWHSKVSMPRAFGSSILMHGHCAREDRLEICRFYAETVDRNITSFLRRCPHSMTVDLEDIKNQFTAFSKWIGAEGDIAQALSEFDIYHNRNKKPFENITPSLAINKISRAVRHFPDWIRQV